MRECPCFRANRNRRGALRTDVGAGRCEWVRGRAVPVSKIGVGLPDIFKWSIGSQVTVSSYGVDDASGWIDRRDVVKTAICTHYDTGLLVLT